MLSAAPWKGTLLCLYSCSFLFTHSEVWNTLSLPMPLNFSSRVFCTDSKIQAGFLCCVVLNSCPNAVWFFFWIAQRHFWNAACPALSRIFDDPGLWVKLIHTSWAIVSLINIGIAYSVSWLQFGLDDPGFKSRQRQGFFFSFTKLPDRLWGLPTHQWGQGQFYLYLFTPSFYETRPSFLRLVCRNNTFIL